MSINVGLFLVVLTFFTMESLAKSSFESGECRKDIILVVDTSSTIGETSFNNEVKPFLKSLVTDTTLNVGRDDTQIAMIIFSQKEKTEMLLKFGDIYNKAELENFIELLEWNDVNGDHTRTDLALQIANKVFAQPNPLNNRPGIDDVVIIITDGKPHGKSYAKDNAIRNATRLKDKDIIIVALSVGPQRKNFLDVLQEMATSNEYSFEASFEDMDKILGKLVASSCTKPGECTCQVAQMSPIYVKPGESTAEVNWPIPTYVCQTGEAEEESFIVYPPLSPPQDFPVGNHTITYTFKLEGGVDVVCPVEIEVKGELCRGIAFDPKTQVCCCGDIYVIQPGNECCGGDYYNTSKQRCCPNSNVVSENESCPSG